ncbi:MAG: hypothetical protein U9O18_01325 [Chloroflexota bacterium]|nr:hypothetical protein [Chloroflexota bacterium]
MPDLVVFHVASVIFWVAFGMFLGRFVVPRLVDLWFEIREHWHGR